MSYQSLKRRSYEVLEKGQTSDKWSRRIDIFIITLILLNILAVILESVEALRIPFEDWFYHFELFSICVFTAEYVLRIWSITEKEENAHPIKGRLKYIFSFYGLIDLMALLPAYIPLLVKSDLRIIRGIRILRLFRILKLSRYNRAFDHIKNVVKATKEELIISLIAVLTLLVIASSLMYFIEHDVQPEAFPSIPATMWWGVATLTTVGYGDVFPVTDLGKVMAGLMAILGIGIFALPAGILANGFGNTIEERKNEDAETCNECGQKLKK